MEFLLAGLPFLFFLACPLMMVLCMVGMRKKGCSAPSASVGPTSSASPEARAAALENQLMTIQSELLALRTEEAKRACDNHHDAVRLGATATPEAGHVTQ